MFTLFTVISLSALLPLFFCFSSLLTSVYLTVSLHLLLLSPGATLEFQLFSAYVCVFLRVFECRCVCVCTCMPVAVSPYSRALVVLQAVWGVRAMCVDPVETPGISAVWQTAYSSGGGGGGFTRFNGIVCVFSVRVSWGWQADWSHGEALTSCALIQSLCLRYILVQSLNELRPQPMATATHHCNVVFGIIWPHVAWKLLFCICCSCIHLNLSTAFSCLPFLQCSWTLSIHK